MPALDPALPLRARSAPLAQPFAAPALLPQSGDLDDVFKTAIDRYQFLATITGIQGNVWGQAFYFGLRTATQATWAALQLNPFLRSAIDGKTTAPLPPV